MEHYRPKIAALNEKELATLLAESFFKIGKVLKLPAGESKIFLDEVYKYQGQVYADTFSDAFSRYAACELPDAETLRPYVSPLFVGKLMRIYLNKFTGKKNNRKPERESRSNLNPGEKYKLFILFVKTNKCVPANPDWVGIYEHLAELGKLLLMPGWDSFNYYKKLKHATLDVSEWTYKNFTITETLLYKNKL